MGSPFWPPNQGDKSQSRVGQIMLRQMERQLEAFRGCSCVSALFLSVRHKMRNHRTRYSSLSAK